MVDLVGAAPDEASKYQVLTAAALADINAWALFLLFKFELVYTFIFLPAPTGAILNVEPGVLQHGGRDDESYQDHGERHGTWERELWLVKLIPCYEIILKFEQPPDWLWLLRWAADAKAGDIREGILLLCLITKPI